MPMTRAHVYVRGRVQGVFFRASTKDRALTLGVTGWVKNCLDGSVEAVFEGKKDLVDKIVNWCRKGPSGARVEQIDVSWEDFTGEFDAFSVVYE
ncbi:MAG: acylphosphatase [Candidatus Brocadia sp.]|jgi:Acylphosphatases|uniref:Acylphosphatase n=1 Tax=Candidatus Brocadia fulgida TaxID=380242 RepID=A0A0M2UZG8_9BACT|nr:MAG: acylphosphatase [Candidatus Brocadia fulgida]MCC6326837.1 acylphosphatase [Candidatus Brocadia sp.]MCE7912099.1 acylphosphatase [Candidatus Brocadia sp. AMX3]MBV6518472.1 Acylphosphatase [Candidatus Brocadia fulgida]MDG5995520.1 acylphosphatase [Candidatus Brocadia sp.]